MNIQNGNLNKVETKFKDMTTIQKIMVVIWFLAVSGMLTGLIIGSADMICGPATDFINSFMVK